MKGNPSGFIQSARILAYNKLMGLSSAQAFAAPTTPGGKDGQTEAPPREFMRAARKPRRLEEFKRR
jgi:hypothetical protein